MLKDIDVIRQWRLPKISEVQKINERVYEIKCINNKKYILKRRPDKDKLNSEYKILKYLIIHGISVPVPLLTITGNRFALYDNQAYTLYEYINGKSIEYNLERDPHNLYYEYCKMLGQYHNVLNKYDGLLDNIDILNQERRMIDYTKEELTQKYPDLDLIKTIDEVYNELKIYLAIMPKQLIHRDINLNNILFNNGKFNGLIDFDPLAIGYKVFDLCFLVLHLSGHIYDEDRLKKWLGIIPKMLIAYRLNNTLNDVEIKSLWSYLVLIELYYAAFKFSVNSPEANGILNIALWIYRNKEMFDKIVK